MKRRIWFLVYAYVISMALGLPALAATIPYIGCPGSDGGEPQPALTGPGGFVDLEADWAPLVAYFAGPYGPALIAPRGWQCFWLKSPDGNYGILVAPNQADLTTFEAYENTGTPGPGMAYDYWNGGGGGREAVLPLAAHFFPKLQNGALKAELAAALQTGAVFPDDLVPAYPADRLTYKSADILAFTTPAEQTGLGTWLPLLFHVSALPIQGLLHVDMSGATAADLFQIRLPDNLAMLQAANLKHVGAYFAGEDGFKAR